MTNITDDYAIHYEAVICKAYNCERNGTEVANADIYRHLLESYVNMISSIEKNKSKNDIIDAKNKFDEKCKLISDNLSKAISELYYTYNSLGKVGDMLPQNSIHGINIKSSTYANKRYYSDFCFDRIVCEPCGIVAHEHQTFPSVGILRIYEEIPRHCIAFIF